MQLYRPTIGIECHVQLNTATKLFSGASNNAREAGPNTTVSPICFGLPGTLPVLNRAAVDLCIKAAVALNANVAPISRFDRKHYFYPDLPKGYQISQLHQPIIGAGYVEVPTANIEAPLKVRIHHAHLEEDAGKLTHPTKAQYSLVDLNRAGTPVIEIVSEPDMHSAEEAKAYANELYQLMTYAGVTDGDLYHGNMRFDVNISVAKKDATQLGVRSEIKNINSFRSVQRVVEYEFARQVELLEEGKVVVQETRGWDEPQQKTVSQRSKEDAHDYRYMPEPDIPPIVLEQHYIDEVVASMPCLPRDFRQAFEPLGLDNSVVTALLALRPAAELVKAVASQSETIHARRIAHWFASGTYHPVHTSGANQTEPRTIRYKAQQFIELSEMVTANELSSTAAKTVFNDMLQSSKSPRAIAEAHNLLQVSDESDLTRIVDEVLASSQAAAAVADVGSGNHKAQGFIIGLVMKKTNGKANPSIVGELIARKLQQ